MKILITGIHGFVGSNLVIALKSQHTLYGLDITSPEKEGVQKTYGWDELDQIPQADVIIHLAGKAHDTKNTSAAKDYYDINVGLTQKIFEYFIHSGAKKFIFFSSVKAVADQVKGAELTEEEIPNPQTPYGQSKLEAEEYIESRKSEVGSRKTEDGSSQSQSQSTDPELVTRNPQPELRTPNSKLQTVYILRPCMIHGPGNKGNLNLLYSIQKKGLPWPLGAFKNKRSFCSVDNLRFVIQQIIEKPVEPGIYQVADDEALSTNDVIRMMADTRNKKAGIWSIPEQGIRLVARAGDFLHLPLNSERLRKLTESYVVSNQKIKKALGIDQMPVSARDGLKKTLESF
jgi:nucleoside-diphosphate-sugar epimerase